MKTYQKTLGTLALLSGLAVGYAQTTASTSSKPTRKAQAAAAAPAALPTTQEPQPVSANPQAAGSSSSDNTVAGLNASDPAPAPAPQADQGGAQPPVAGPDTIRFKGITISPTGSFLAGETVWRQRATGGGINTPFTSIPLADQPEYYYSEFYGSGRQSRIAVLAEGKLDHMTLRGYYEADFLNAGVTSNNNQSNSYPLRQRQVWAQAELNSGWTFTGGQMWSLATEDLSGITNRTEAVPLTIDPQYEPGFVWLRQYGFRVTKDFSNKMWLGVSAENPQVLNLVGHNLPYNFIYGQLGTGGGLYNATANYSANPAPDMIAKAVFEPGWGHYELFGIARFFRDRVYPNDTASSSSSAGAYNSDSTGGGIGGSFRVPTLKKHLDVGLSGLWGDGIGRYGDTQIGDATVHPNGTLALLHGFSALSTLILHLAGRLDIYANYGGDEAFRTYHVTSATKAVGYGSYLNNTSGCSTEAAPASSNAGATPGTSSTCSADTKDIQQFTAGYWYDFYRGPAGRLRQGVQYTLARRDIWSGTAGAPNATDNMFWTSFRYYLP